MINRHKLILFYREKYIFLYFNFAILFFLISMYWIIWQTDIHVFFVPLHYNAFFGIDKIGPWQQLIIYPGLAFAFTTINFIAGYLIFSKDKYLSYYLAIAAFLISLLTTIHIITLTIFTL